jgi:hypothetical protein
MRYSGFFVLFLTGAFLTGCEETLVIEKAPEDFPLERLAGKWEDVDSENKFYEEWTVVGDSMLIGKGYVMVSADTVFIENLRILKEKEGTFYQVNLSSNQSEKPEVVKFKMTSSGETDIVFENPQHDFPKKITYRMISNTEMRVFLNGIENGTFGETRFSFVRTN